MADKTVTLNASQSTFLHGDSSEIVEISSDKICKLVVKPDKDASSARHDLAKDARVRVSIGLGGNVQVEAVEDATKVTWDTKPLVLDSSS